MTKQKTHVLRILTLALACAMLLPLFLCLPACSGNDYNTPVKTVTTADSDERYPLLLHLNKDGKPLSKVSISPSFYLDSAAKPDCWEYDETGKLIRYITGSSGNRLIYTYTYDEQNRPIRGVARDSFGQPNGSVCLFEYFEDGHYRIDYLWRGVIARQELYNKKHQLLKTKYPYPGIDAYTYEYDNNGNVSAMYLENDASRRISFDYDEKDRVVKMHIPNVETRTYTYDRSGRMIE